MILTHFADIFRYASEGVRKSAGIVTYKGTIFGAFARSAEADKTSLTVSNDGLILAYGLINMYQRHATNGLLVEPSLVTTSSLLSKSWGAQSRKSESKPSVGTEYLYSVALALTGPTTDTHTSVRSTQRCVDNKISSPVKEKGI